MVHANRSSVDLFYVGNGMQRTNTLFVHDIVTVELCSSLMDKGWNMKITRICDVEFVNTTIAEGSLKFRYHVHLQGHSLRKLYLQQTQDVSGQNMGGHGAI